MGHREHQPLLKGIETESTSWSQGAHNNETDIMKYIKVEHFMQSNPFAALQQQKSESGSSAALQQYSKQAKIPGFWKRQTIKNWVLKINLSLIKNDFVILTKKIIFSW